MLANSCVVGCAGAVALRSTGDGCLLAVAFLAAVNLSMRDSNPK
jgi:hypothetical protein